MYVESTDLVQRSDRIGFRSLFPLILRQLIRNTSTGMKSIDLPVLDASEQRGYDGIVEVGGGNEYVPNGKSVWEISTQDGPKGKANSDYKKRTESPGIIVPKETTFVFVTSRRWHDKNEWIEEKKKDSPWKDVKVIDANNIEDWLYTSNSTHIWTSIALGKYSENAIDLGNHWLNVAGSTTPNLSSDLVLAGRETLFSDIETSLSMKNVVSLRANSKIECLAIIAAIFTHSSGNDLKLLLNTIIVHDIISWRRLILSQSPLVLIPTFDDLYAIPNALRQGHKVIVPKGKEDAIVEDEIKIPDLSIQLASKALLDMGFDQSKCDKNALLAKRDFVSFIQSNAIAPQPIFPEIITREGIDLVPPILLGSWDESFHGDQEIVEKIAKTKFVEYKDSLHRISNKTGSPISRFGNIIKTREREKTLIQLISSVTPEQASSFRDESIRVLSTVDPKFELPLEQRWMSVAYGAIPTYSGTLQEGIAESLAIIRANEEFIPNIASFSTSQYIQNIVDRALRQLGTDWKAWASVSSVLPLLAEASPDELLSAIDRGMKEKPPVFTSIFTDKGDPTFTSSPHTGLLWALETLAWNPEYLGYSSLLLAQLARIDPGGNYTNRPINSLDCILNFIIPYTCGTLEQRLAVIDTLLEKENEIAWNILIKIIPTSSRFINPSREPKWQKWSPDGPQRVSQSEIRIGLSEVVQRIMDNIDNKGARLSDLIRILPSLPQPEYEKVYSFVSEYDPEELDDTKNVWDTLREVISRHKSYPDAKWSLPEEEISRIESIFESLEPGLEQDTFVWLFSETPNLLNGTSIGREDYFDTVERMRYDALSGFKKNGLSPILELITEVESPRTLGFTLSTIEISEEEENRLLSEYLASESHDEAAFIRGYIWGISNRKEETLIKLYEELDEGLNDSQKGHLLTSLPLEKETWDYVDSLDPEIKNEYWDRINPYAIKDFSLGAEKLVEVGKPYSAMVLLSFHLEDEKFDFSVAITALENSLKVPIEQDHPILQSFDYHVSSLFTKLEETSGVNMSQLAKLEWAYLPLIQRHKESNTVLHSELSRDPSFFNVVLGLVYRSQTEDQPEITEEQREHAMRGYELLNSWSRIPGLGAGGIDGDVLKSWISTAREMNESSGLGAIGDHEIGTMLSHAPADSDGNWPNPVICSIIEEISNDDLSSGFETGIFNSRGVVSKLPIDGGKQEHELAEYYAQKASSIRDHYPKTSMILRRISNQYREFAKKEDEDVDKLFFM